MKTTPCKAEISTNISSYPYHNSPRCGAKTRKGTACKSPAVQNKKRCRMHGGAIGSGAPSLNQNALKHGFTTIKAKSERKYIKLVLHNYKNVITNLK